jgi:hypothetical protein
MKKLLLIIATVGLLSCASESEQQSLDRIAEIYDAKTSYSKGFSSSAGKETIRNFTAKVSGSDLIDSLNPNVTSSNIALLVYQGFEEDEKDKYNNIFVQMVNKKGDTADYTYPIPVLKKVAAKSPVFNVFSESVMKGDDGKIDEIRDPESMPDPIGERLMITITKYKDKYGSIIDYEPFGIAELSDSKGAAYQFQSYMVFSSGKKIPYVVNIQTAPEHQKVYGFRFFE